MVVHAGKTYTNAQILALTEFQERFFKPTVVRHKLIEEDSHG